MKLSDYTISAREIYGRDYLPNPPAGYRLTGRLEVLRDDSRYLDLDGTVKCYTIGEKDRRLVRMTVELDPIEWVIDSKIPVQPSFASFYLKDGMIWKVPHGLREYGRYILVRPTKGSRTPIQDVDYTVLTDGEH